MLKRIAVIEVDDATRRRYPYKPPFPLTVIVNPVIEPLTEETLLINEGCLSVPGLRGDVERRTTVRVHYLDRNGGPGEVVVDGLTAGTFQHEVDHLDGILFPRAWRTPARSHLGGVQRHHQADFLERIRPYTMTRSGASYAWLGGETPQPRRPDRDPGRPHRAPSPSRRPPRRAPNGSTGWSSPGFANAHSHAFQRALRGRTHAADGLVLDLAAPDVRLAGSLDPDSMLAVTRAAFAEMALAGITLVGEFHYVHHGPGGGPYGDPNAMGAAVIQAAAEAGVRLTLLDACYLDGGLEPDPIQQRFFDPDVEAWAERVERPSHGPRFGSAPRSTACAPLHPSRPPRVARWADEREAPFHAHVSEQRAENAACREVYGATPTALLHYEGALSERFTAVHATHVSEEDIALLGGCRRLLLPVPDDRARPRRRDRPRPPPARRRLRLDRRHRLERDDRAARGGARDRARRASRHRRARRPQRRRAARGRDRCRLREPRLA